MIKGKLIGMFIIAIALWDTVFIYPIKLFVVMLHEISHGLDGGKGLG